MNQELLPCPFCGGQNFARGHRTMTDRSHEPVVLCLDCDCRGPLAAWNTRSPPPEDVGVEDIARVIYANLHHLMGTTGTAAQTAYEGAARAILAVLNPPTSEKPKP